jgi:lysozyme family protein
MLLKRPLRSYLVPLSLNVLLLISGEQWLNINLRGKYKMSFDKNLINTLNYEGGVTVDSGGLTNYGVRQDIYNSYTKLNKLPSKSVKELNYGEVRDFYENEYYKKPQIDKLPESIQGIVFDSAVNLGQGTTVKHLQEIVGSKPDGIIGKKTLAAINEYIKNNDEDSLKVDLLNRRITHYKRLVEQNPAKYEKYLNGWMNRIGDLTNKSN